MTRIALIHALAESVAPINDALARSWPEAQRMNLLDDSLSADLARDGALEAAMFARFANLAGYAASTGCAAILFTCSAFGPCIEAVARQLAPLPVLKPNEAMIDEVVRAGGRIGLVATFAPTLDSMPAEFPPELTLETELAAGALDALRRGDPEAHDRLAADAAARLVDRGCSLIALAQFSLARAAPVVAARTGRPVLTTVDSAIRALRGRVAA
jgi:Asp/Glu/hydantoin racemase